MLITRTALLGVVQEVSLTLLKDRTSQLGAREKIFRVFFIQFNVPFKIISAHMRRANQ